jgi:protein-tyrosine phosphatase
MKLLRRVVSGHNRRFQSEGFDLDLTYVTPRWIAMGFPSQGFQSNYRNPATMVASFLENRHPDHFKVFNLSEATYSSTVFKGPVAHYPFPDHHAPSFPTIIAMMKDMHDWLAADAENVVAVHCLAGHGRTGVIICALFLFEDVYVLPDEARGPVRLIEVCHYEAPKGAVACPAKSLGAPFLCVVTPGESLADLRQSRLSSPDLARFVLDVNGEMRVLSNGDVPFDVVPPGGRLRIEHHRGKSTPSLTSGRLRRD